MSLRDEIEALEASAGKRLVTLRRAYNEYLQGGMTARQMQTMALAVKIRQLKHLLKKRATTRAERAKHKEWKQKVKEYEAEVENARAELKRMKEQRKKARYNARINDKEKCSARRKTKDPLCEADDKCQWVVGQGCLPAERNVEDPTPNQMEGMAQEEVHEAEERLEEAIQEGPEEKRRVGFSDCETDSDCPGDSKCDTENKVCKETLTYHPHEEEESSDTEELSDTDEMWGTDEHNDPWNEGNDVQEDERPEDNPFLEALKELEEEEKRQEEERAEGEAEFEALENTLREMEEEKRRREEEVRRREEEERRLKEERERLRWVVADQGDEDFQRKLREKIYQEGHEAFDKVKDRLDDPGCRGRDPFAYQELVGAILHPYTGINRFLCVWKTGAGKTLAMIKILNNVCEDPLRRPVVLLFPTQSTVNNFNREIAKFSNRFKTHYNTVGNSNGIKNAFNEKTDLQIIKDTLARKNDLAAFRRGEGLPPLRAMTYTTAGGSTARNLKAPFSYRPRRFAKRKNPFDGMIVVADEVHNLLAGVYAGEPYNDTKKAEQYTELSKSHKKLQLKNMRDLAGYLQSARDGALFGMTATPIVHDREQDGRALLDLIKGEEHKNKSDHGFISYFNEFPRSMYPTPTYDHNLNHFSYANVKTIDLGPIVAAKYLHYAATSKKGHKDGQYTNTAFYARQILSNKNSQKGIEDFPDETATKIKAIAKELATRKKKSMILVHREDGAKPLPEILEKVGCKPNSGCGSVSLLYKTNATKQTNDALAERKDAFNQKGNGESTVIVADAKDYSEGVSFFQVDYMAIVNPPSTWGSFLQRIGRVLRACDTPLREIFICMYVAKIPNQLTFDKAVYNKLPNTLKKAVSWVINEYATDDQKKAWGARSRSARSRSRKPKGPCKGLKRDDCKGECEWTKKNQSKRNACWPRERQRAIWTTKMDTPRAIWTTNIFRPKIGK